MLPPLSAIGNAHVEIFGPDIDSARWDIDTWDNAVWADFSWRDVTPQGMKVDVSWGADDPSGVLTVPAAGSWSVNTYDPDRLLDPSNSTSPYASALRPGRPMRLIADFGTGIEVVRQGLIDEIEFDLASYLGAIRGTDGVMLMVAAKMLPGLASDPLMPMTLRARARYLLTKSGVGNIITVEDDPEDEPDPSVGPIDDREAACWTHIQSAAFDCLYAAWMDRHGILRFRAFGTPVDDGFQIGGSDGIPIETVKAHASMDSVFTRIVGRDMTAPDVDVIVVDDVKASIYGHLTMVREAPVPNALDWVTSILADRSGAALQYIPGTLYPQTPEQLISILDLGMISVAHIAVETVNPPIDVAPRILGGKIMVDTGTGWTAELITYIPANEWADSDTPPEVIQPPQPTNRVTRTYNCTKDTRIVRDLSSGGNWGSGADSANPVGKFQGLKNRVAMGFASIPFGDVVKVVKAELQLDTLDYVKVNIGPKAKFTTKRLTESFAEGSASTPSSGNSTVWPGPSSTSSGAVTHKGPYNGDVAFSVDITAIVKAWQSGAKQHGLMLISAGEDNSDYTTQFYTRTESNTNRRPSLKLTLDVKV